MTDESTSATAVVPAPAWTVFSVLADPARHGAIDGTYEMADLVLDVEPPHVIS